MHQFGDAKVLRRVDRRRRHEHGRQAHQRVERRHQLRHVGHLDGARHIGADAAADGQPADDEQPAQPVARPRHGERGEDGDAHAEHAEPVALPGRCGAREATQRQDEQHARNEIEQCSNISGDHNALVQSALRARMNRPAVTSPAATKKAAPAAMNISPPAPMLVASVASERKKKPAAMAGTAKAVSRPPRSLMALRANSPITSTSAKLRPVPIMNSGESMSRTAQPFFLYIASLRWVPRKPPNMWTRARIRAKRPKILAPRLVSAPTGPPRSSASLR